MSEKIYALLLRLFPSRFRDGYGEDAMQLFRDRSRDEAGLLARFRLWVDLLVDLAISVPREHGYLWPELHAAPAVRVSTGVPLFFFVEHRRPSAASLLLGSALSLLALAAIWLSPGPAGSFAARRMHASDPPADAASAHVSPGQASLPPQAVDKFTSNAPGISRQLDSAERHRVVAAAAEILKEHYVDRDNAAKMAESLLTHEKNGDDDAAAEGFAFAALLTRQMREVTLDRHLTLDYSATPLPEQPDSPTPEGLARFHETLKQRNCMFEKVALLRNRIGYLRLNAFPDPSVCQATAAAAMASLNDAEALIFDLRDNRGGQPAMVAFLAAYLFDHPEYWYSPRENTTVESWTKSPVSGNKLADKPVFILTSKWTSSGAEQFCYDLKMLKRATLVGETTAGAAHSGIWHRIDDHFGMGIPETRSINPFAPYDWAETGVEPDVKVKAAEALPVAEKLAEKKRR